MPVIRHEDPAGDASRALFAEYMDLVRERLGAAFVPTEQIFATEDDFDAAGAAWLVVYEDDRPVACGGLVRRERVRLYTTEVLREARALYSARGYRPVGVVAIDGRIDLWLEKRLAA